MNPIKEVVSKTNSFDGNEEDSSLSEVELHLEVSIVICISWKVLSNCL